MEEESLRILHVSTSDVVGGAARCAHRLHRGLLASGATSEMLVRRRKSGDPTVRRFTEEAGLLSSLGRRARRLLGGRNHGSRDTPDWVELFSDDRSRLAVERSEAVGRCDLLHLHWVAGFVDYRRFFGKLPEGVPVVWTLHDMNPFTGGCHYDFGCGRYRESCGRCPQLGSRREDDPSRAVWSRKERLFSSMSRDRLHLVTPSRWLAGEVGRSSLFDARFDVSVIPNGIDLDGYAPRDRGLARRVLDIPPDARVLLFVAESVRNRRKGFDLLCEALARSTDVSGLLLLSIGKGEADLGLDVPYRALGYTDEDRLLSLVYSAADLFVIPSRQDNLPTTVIEAFACGVPVVGFRTGGIPEMIDDGRTGWLARPEDPRDLAAVLRRRMADLSGLRRAGRKAREVALKEYALDLQVGRYRSLYERLTDSGSNPVERRRAPRPGGRRVHPEPVTPEGGR